MFVWNDETFPMFHWLPDDGSRRIRLRENGWKEGGLPSLLGEGVLFLPLFNGDG